MKATALDHVALRVKDIAASRRFYETHFGMRLALVKNERQIWLQCGGQLLGLMQASGGAPEPERPGRGVDHVAIRVAPEAFDAAVGELRAAGVRVQRGPVDRPEEGSRSFYFYDPDEYLVEVIAWTRSPFAP